MLTLRTVSVLICAMGASVPALAGEVKVAVAANFLDAISTLGEQFEQKTGHKVLISSGSTGKLYAQIKNEAPFDVFFAADDKRPELLEQENAIVPGSRFTYAMGTLVLWSPDEKRVDDDLTVLKNGDFRFLAVANPVTAPYGRAAQEVLVGMGLWDNFNKKMVRGENIGQTYQYVYSRNADLGFVAKSQVFSQGEYSSGSWWEVPADQYAPIVQQAVQLTDTPAAKELLEYVRSAEGLKVIHAYGYGTETVK
ncbi:molybdate ABC transporter substrate-binding protein [Oceanimonas baumannii]|uniref:Molybdate ABC transporter substrate-binding protein n=1 Tax=Oceanimonas baumannii TaxID=129578 RepID=A0A235CNS5_9GAMM|nr:molybdate ABC transporter substrate-binding protein [Oceanimonas baumannii]OYD26086.1 molybdate ABC transporter substrate-binding protein [Oceanimonas baumannii]TDW62269.1 molybdate transport system substrate-binding protein [Oceanimonas baumannii]